MSTGDQPAPSGEIAAQIIKAAFEDDGLSHERQHMHFIILVGPHGPDKEGNMVGSTKLDLIATDREGAENMAKDMSPEGFTNIAILQQVMHHPHPNGAE